MREPHSSRLYTLNGQKGLGILAPSLRV